MFLKIGIYFLRFVPMYVIKILVGYLLLKCILEGFIPKMDIEGGRAMGAITRPYRYTPTFENENSTSVKF